MKNIICQYCASLGVIFILYSCGFVDDIKKDKNDSDPKLSIGSIETVDTPVLKSGFMANGVALLKLNISLEPTPNVVENRKVSLFTSIGTFIVAEGEKNATELMLNEAGKGVAYIKSPVAAGSGIVTATSVNGIAKYERGLVFGIAEPETVILETPTYAIRDSSTTLINISLTRGQGNVSDGQKGTFQLMSGMTVLGDRVSFIESSSSKDGKASCKMVLEKIPIGKYKIKATFGSKVGEREIEVIKIESPKITK